MIDNSHKYWEVEYDKDFKCNLELLGVSCHLIDYLTINISGVIEDFGTIYIIFDGKRENFWETLWLWTHTIGEEEKDCVPMGNIKKHIRKTKLEKLIK